MVACKIGDSLPSNIFNQPWIIQCHGPNKHTTTFIDPMKINDVEEKEIYEIQGKLCFGCIDEWLFLWDEQSKECFFLELNSLSKVHLPPLPRENNIMNSFSLSSSPNHSDCIVIFTGAKFEHETNNITDRFLMCCRLHDEKWTKLLLDEEDQCLIGETCVVLDGKLYAYGIGKVIVFDVMSLLEGRIDTTTITGPMSAIYPKTDMVSTHLVGSCGHIYLVRMYTYGMGPTINMDIHHLDTCSDKWSRVDSIGERAFFLSHTCYTSVCAMDAGVSCNCIYYVVSEKERRIYKFCLDDHTMTFTLTSIEQTEHESSFCWFVPKRSRQMITNSSASPTIVLNEDIDYEVFMDEKITSNTSRPWDDLPMDLLELLVRHVSLVDSIHLFAVCKVWNLTSNSIPMAKTCPWLMYQEKLDGTYKLLDSLNGKEYTKKIELPSSVFPTQMLCSKDGWVIVLGGNGAMFMVNPMIQHVVKLPALEVTDEDFHGITFTSIPTSLDCVVIGICTDRCDNSIEFHVWHAGEEEWTIIYDDEIPFCIANTNPVFLNGKLYYLGETGELGVFDPVEQSWVTLDKPKPVYTEDHDPPFRGTEDCYLLELGGDLVSVFRYNYFNYEICVFKLDKLKMEWIKVEDLAGWTIFLDPRSSFAKLSPHKSSWSNKIFFTAIYSGTTKTSCASYCMESKRYEINFCDTKKPLDCVWFEPNLGQKSLMDEP